ncbi:MULTISPECIES: hypothetical protein [unclassified Streptomyces]|uniref:hypothetical protein n=1 Tax=unclassified Streptomyces TaxID=2593676 RepID=UPI001660F0BA|nr:MULTISPECIES: hypothetical protein [unclassified Streptomyces]MBD0710402.1 hypothetical protein [Streptomyces sp. CBMA291]MBD0712737.1 hypothetical protein [Streptomyces sp. CBMA370]
MYLVHVTLQPGSPGLFLPRDTRELLWAAAHPEDRIEHVVVHPDAVPAPMLGVYVLADSLASAERQTFAFCRRALEAAPQLALWTAGAAAASFVALFYERLLSAPDAPGRNGPGTVSAS